jgi:hypothetical protein
MQLLHLFVGNKTVPPVWWMGPCETLPAGRGIPGHARQAERHHPGAAGCGAGAAGRPRWWVGSLHHGVRLSRYAVGLGGPVTDRLF